MSTDPIPRFTIQDAVRMAATHFGLRVQAKLLVSYADQNFRLEDETGQRFILKVAHAEEEQAVLDFQNQALQHLVQAAPTLSCPHVYPTLTGALTVEVEGASGRTHAMRLLTYLPGTFLADVQPHSPALLRSLGTFMGRLDTALATFAHPAMHRVFEWDLKQSMTLASYTDGITDVGSRALVEQGFARFEAYVSPRLSQLPASVIHNDANDCNVLVGPVKGQAWGVIGLIDFGDIVHTPTICELAIAATYAMLDKPDPVAAAAAVVAGYHAARPLLPGELDVLMDLIITRLCASVTLSARQRARDPENAYVGMSERPAWALLHRLVEVDLGTVRDAFQKACTPHGGSTI